MSDTQVCHRCKEEFDYPWYGDILVNAQGEEWLKICNDCLERMTKEFGRR